MRYVWAVLASALCGDVWARDCNALKGDEYATCNAVEQNNPRFCEDVKVADVRLMCQAKVQPNSYTCEKIKAASCVRIHCSRLAKVCWSLISACVKASISASGKLKSKGRPWGWATCHGVSK